MPKTSQIVPTISYFDLWQTGTDRQCAIASIPAGVGLRGGRPRNIKRSAMADGQRDALCQTKTCQLLHNCGNKLYKKCRTNRRIKLQGYRQRRVMCYVCPAATCRCRKCDLRARPSPSCADNNDLLAVAKYFKSRSNFGRSFRVKYLIIATREFPYNSRAKEAPIPTTSSIRLAVLTELRLVTDGHCIYRDIRASRSWRRRK